MEEHIELLKQKLEKVYLGEAFNGKMMKKARSHGKKFQVTVTQETSRLLVIRIEQFIYLANWCEAIIVNMRW